MLGWIQQIAAIWRKVNLIMEELELLQSKLSAVSEKLDVLGTSLSAEVGELKADLAELVDSLRSDPVDLTPVIAQAEALAGKVDGLDEAVKAISESVFPVPAPVEPPVE